ncbi:hypothetical protein [Streptomyces griseus]|uniref:hypothetical protein n=1 Tax=Streptomyces griseus TaxID=1911 RepID=UPI00131EA401|nr:hypothetical protein [Streptomyces griseus]
MAAVGRRGYVEGLVGDAFHPVVAGKAVQPVGVVGGEPALFAVEVPRLVERHLVEGDVVADSRGDDGGLFARRLRTLLRRSHPRRVCFDLEGPPMRQI